MICLTFKILEKLLDEERWSRPEETMNPAQPLDGQKWIWA
jgi:hypothetical protein